MKAAIYEQYGPPEVLVLKDLPKPTPSDKEVLVKVHATTVTAGDTTMRDLNIPGLFWQRLFARLYLEFDKPKRTILGMELTGKMLKRIGMLIVGTKLKCPMADLLQIGELTKHANRQTNNW